MNRPKRTRIADIAAHLGVSNATVSRGLSGDGYVSADLSARIRAAAVELNYRLPQAVAGRRVILAASQDAMVDFQRSQFTMYVMEGLRARAQLLGLEVDIQSFQDFTSIRAQCDQAGEDLLGVLLLTVDLEDLTSALDLPCPVVLVNGDDPAMRISSVTPCNRSAAAMATQRLVDQGHRRIAFLTKPGRRTIQRRLEGWRDVMGAAATPELIINSEDWTAEAAQDAVAQALRSGVIFTGLVAAGDVLAAGALAALHGAGKAIPQDVSVAGVDGLPQSQYLSPPLSGIKIPMAAVGAQALDLLADAARARAAGSAYLVRRVELACTPVAGASVGPVPTAR